MVSPPDLSPLDVSVPGFDGALSPLAAEGGLTSLLAGLSSDTAVLLTAVTLIVTAAVLPLESLAVMTTLYAPAADGLKIAVFPLNVTHG